ncbi:MAG: radical SAM protein [Thermoplasmataceae archaeon]
MRLVRGCEYIADFTPQKIYITSLFTYSWKPVHESIEFYHKMFPNAEIYVGGIYATLMSQHVRQVFPYANVHLGLVKEAENMLPAYHLLKQVDKWKDWDRSIVFTSRGCIRKCQFCVVPKVEGGMRDEKPSILDLMHPNHKKVTIWDNNFLASPYAKSMLKELSDHGIEADFNQGLDARLMDEETAGLLADVKSKTIHMAYDWPWEGPYIQKAINLLGDAGYKKKNLIFYMLYNFWDEGHKKGDTPEDFLLRLKNLMKWGASVYPMRFIPLNSLTRTGYVSPLWNAEQLEMIADARRVLGFAGTWVPYRALADKFIYAETFEQAMELRPKVGKKITEEPIPMLY